MSFLAFAGAFERVFPGVCRYLIRPSSLSPQPSPLTDERKLLQDQKLRKRHEPTGAANTEHEPTAGAARSRDGSEKARDAGGGGGGGGASFPPPVSGNRCSSLPIFTQIPVIYYDSEDEDTDSDPSTTPPDLAKTFTPTTTTTTTTFQPQPLQAVVDPHSHPLERSNEFDAGTPDSLDLPMADMDVTSSCDSLSDPRPRVGLSGTIV
ncbi:hypothetical protein ACOMHN_023761 [Nucella lapillus]